MPFAFFFVLLQQNNKNVNKWNKYSVTLSVWEHR